MYYSYELNESFLSFEKKICSPPVSHLRHLFVFACNNLCCVCVSVCVRHSDIKKKFKLHTYTFLINFIGLQYAFQIRKAKNYIIFIWIFFCYLYIPCCCCFFLMLLFFHSRPQNHNNDEQKNIDFLEVYLILEENIFILPQKKNYFSLLLIF